MAIYTPEQTILNLVLQEWRSLPADKRPNGIWLRRYPMGAGESHPILFAPRPVEAAWFIGEEGVEPRTLWDWRRFYTLQFEQPWRTRPRRETIDDAGHMHRVGLAAYSPHADHRSYYLEILLGPRYGIGLMLTIGSDGMLTNRQGIWMS